jgi:FKBP-type peptidyl-prolyl cis-trans isomerase FklB
MKLALAFGFGLALLQLNAAAQDKPASPKAATNAPAVSPKEHKENMSYAIGMNIGNGIKGGGVDLDVDVMAGAIKDVLAGRAQKLTDAEARDAMGAYQQEARARRETLQREITEKNHKDGAAFLAENKKKPGIKTVDVKLADGTMAEMQYKVITEGTGATPKSNDMVTVTYRGTLIGGKEFDNTAKRGAPSKYPVNHVIRGWSEAWQMMKVGSKWELYLPSTLGYEDRGLRPNVEPGAALIFEMELVGSESAPPPQAAPPSSPQPLTSDIIRVPSAEELKKGAKIEVIKPEDLEKLTNAAAQKAEKK